MSASKNEIPLKVLIHKQEERVVFAEANSDFVDILLSFLTMPMGTIVRLLSNNSNTSQPLAIGSFNNLYGSIANLEDKYFASKACKDILLNTRNSAEAQCQKLKVNVDGIDPIEYFTCEDHDCTGYFSIDRSVNCQKCRKFLNREAFFCDTTVEDEQGVFVQPIESFIVTDDLHVIPNIPAFAFALLENSGITDFGVLEEKTFQIGYTEILDLLKCSFLLKTPLTSMLLGKDYNKSYELVQMTTSCMSTDQGLDSFKKIKVTVVVQKSENRILLAYSSEDFIDFLFSFITIPLGRVISLLRKDHPRALSVENIYQSVSDLDVGEYFKSQEIKNMLLSPQFHILYHWADLYIPPKEEERIQTLYGTKELVSGFYIYWLTIDSSVDSRTFKFTSSLDEGRILSTKYMVTDDMVVTPLSSMSCIKYIQSCKIPPSDIEEQVVDIGMEDAMKLLTASLLSTSVLNNGLKHLIQTRPTTTLVKNPKEEK